MTEKDKRDRGEWYDANYDKEILAERMRCQDLCFEYNQLRPSDIARREEYLKRILGKVKGRAVIEQPFHCDNGYNIIVGDNFYCNYNCIILDEAPVSFGDNVFIAPNCGFYTALHPLDSERRNAGLEQAKPITVGNNVWIGGGVTVLAGVHIGSGSVIGAGSVVTKDIPDNTLAYGNPCKPIRTIA